VKLFGQLTDGGIALSVEDVQNGVLADFLVHENAPFGEFILRKFEKLPIFQTVLQ
jgi:hypothetical protein